jgi:hypothetical protein
MDSASNAIPATAISGGEYDEHGEMSVPLITLLCSGSGSSSTTGVGVAAVS